jgi:hypothetical protein
MAQPQVAGFSIVRNATILDFPLEASVGSVLPGVDEFVLAVGRSDDDTLARAHAMAAVHPAMRIIETEWDFSRGSLVLSEQTDIAMQACKAPWGIYIQADEVLADGGALTLRQRIAEVESDEGVEGLIVDYLHFYGSFDTIGTSRRWYRREVRAVRLDRGIHSHGDAQGFRVGIGNRRVRCRKSGVRIFHYSSARPAWVLRAKREHDRAIYATEQRKNPDRPLLPWSPGLRRFRDEHPALVRGWIEERRGAGSYVEPASFHRGDLKVWISMGIEKLTGWRPFEFRNYTLRL